GWNMGFRVTCGSARQSDGPLPPPGDRDAAVAFLATAAGDDPDLLRLRGDLRGEDGDWKLAMEDYGKLVEGAQSNPEDWTVYAAMLLKAGERRAYLSLRGRMLDRYETTTDPRIAERVAKACLLAEGAALGRVSRLLETAFKTEESNWTRPYAELTR